MEEVEFIVHGDFDQPLADRFDSFINGLTSPCLVTLNIESKGGYTEILGSMETQISAKKAEGFVFKTVVNNFAYSCGLFLYLLGDIKICADDARFMFHSSGLKVSDRLTSSDLREILEVLENADELTNRILAENTTAQPGMLEILKKNDNFLSKEDLIFLGFMEREYELI